VGSSHNSVRISLAQDQFHFAREPIMKLDTGEVVGFEALAPTASRADFEVLPNGIERDLQLAILLALGYRTGQGFFFSPAMPAAEVGTLLQHWGASSTPNISFIDSCFNERPCVLSHSSRS